MVNDLPMLEFFIKNQGAIKNDGFDKVLRSQNSYNMLTPAVLGQGYNIVKLCARDIHTKKKYESEKAASGRASLQIPRMTDVRHECLGW